MRIDLHSHVLPGIDDGARDTADALAMLEVAAADGTSVLACTPHCTASFQRVRPHEIAERATRLQAEARERGIPMRLVAAGEVDLQWAGQASDEDLRLVSFGCKGHDLLVECPFRRAPRDFDRRLAALRQRGFRVLLAHPERTPALADLDRLAQLVGEGALVQVTAGALCGVDIGWPDEDAARVIVAAGLAHVLASDAHHPRGSRAPLLAEAEAVAADLTSPEQARALTVDNPAAILAGEPLPVPSPR